MKSILLILTFVAFTFVIEAQQFKRQNVKALDENMTSIQASWISMNADTLLDFVVAGVANDQLKVVLYDNQLQKQNVLLTGMKSGYIGITDWDRDNKMDLLISGKTLINTDALFFFKNNGNFTFTKQAQKLLDYSGQFRLADLDNDAIPDIIAFGNTFIRVFSGNTLEKKFELTNIAPADVSVFDMNNDGRNDIIVTGTTINTFINLSNYKFQKKSSASSIISQLSLADLNSDGYFDVIVSDQDNIEVWKNNGDSLIVDSTINHGTKSGLFTGDINSDGKADIVADSIGLIAQVFGDQDRDGKPDVIHLKDSIGSQWLKLYQNITIDRNARPQPPAVGFAVSTFDRTFIFWDPATDDRTSVNSLTYDVRLGTSQTNVIAPSFDLSTSRRMIVGHGNAGTNRSLIIKGLTDNRYFYGIQSIDNAFNGSYAIAGGGICPCFDLVHQDVQACKGAEVKLAGGHNATWLSLSGGFLEKADTLKFIATTPDTLFAFVSQNLDCSKNKVYVIHVNDSPPQEKETIYACNDKPVVLKIQPGWQNVAWDTSPPTTNVDSITFLVTQADTVHVKAKGPGCDYKKDFFIKLSQPVVNVNGDGFQVMKGNSVQLEATGNVKEWQWAPAQTLDNSTIPNPMATPLTTTEYIVTGTDSIGCTASAKTHVMVQETAFVPNLFTPNGDGKNDNLMIYGLTSTGSFNFRIYNREGSTVYETKDVSHATSVGWNGAVQGIRQPSGLYYWKIDGAMPDGSKLLLNGKTTGSILLVQ
jgi:gliding motility-associated-like protein